MHNELFAFYLYGVACLVGGFVFGIFWQDYRRDDDNDSDWL